jgi:glutaconate CoA-transferase, subunit B
VDFGFGSGVQVDKQGNLNSVCIGDYKKPKVRLVGSILLPEHLALFGREYIMMPHHEVRNFVERVDYVSGVGYPGGAVGRRSLGLEMGGPEWIVTPKCIFDFDKIEGRARLKSLHPGVSLEEVRQSTGFDILEKDPERTPEPTNEELEILRRVVDPRSILIPHPSQ